MEDLSIYEADKIKKKQKLVRNEFLNINKSNKYQFPIIKKQDVDIDKIEFISYSNTKVNDTENKNKTVHFFTYDWKFNNVYECPEETIEKLSQYKYLLSPDFSLFIDMPIALQIESVFKNRWCGAYWQSKGLTVIPTVSWSDEKSFDFCFDGIEEGSVVAVCTYYRENEEESFMLGYNEMLKRIKPSAVICYDEAFKNMQGNVKTFLPTTYQYILDLPPDEQIRFYWEKHNRFKSGLNKNDFKYFTYDDPYERNVIKACDVCSNACLVDQFGNGPCLNCGWEQGGYIKGKKASKTEGYPNLVPLHKAKKLYQQAKPFIPDWEDFVNDLNFYGEMQFEYNGDLYIALRYTDDKSVELYKEQCLENKEIYKNIADFKTNAQIDGKHLKLIWKDVKNADWLD